MSSFEALLKIVASTPDAHARVEALVHGLADRVKATSNDQNVQKLARDLHGAAAELAGAATQG